MHGRRPDRVDLACDSTLWWWNPEGIEEDEWHEWLDGVRGLEPAERAHRLASAVASRLLVQERIIRVLCHVHGIFIAEVYATTKGPLWRSRIVANLSGPVISQVALLEFNTFVPVLRAWCTVDGAQTRFEAGHVLSHVHAACGADQVVTLTDYATSAIGPSASRAAHARIRTGRHSRRRPAP